MPYSIASGMVSGMASSTTQEDCMTEKVRENRLRRMAERQGLALRKSRRRDPRAIDYGGWDVLAGRDLRRGNLNIEQVEEGLLNGEFLREGEGR
jgi:hypothetical protein